MPAAVAERASAAAALEEQLDDLRSQIQDLARAHETEVGDPRQELVAAVERHTVAEGRAHDLERDLARVQEQLSAAEEEMAGTYRFESYSALPRRSCRGA